MMDVGSHKFILFNHAGEGFQLQLYASPPWLLLVGDVLADSLDSTLLFYQDAGCALLCTIAGILAIIPVVLLFLSTLHGCCGARP
jgi:hypothetical protein